MHSRYKMLQQIGILWTYARSTVSQALSVFSRRSKRTLVSLPPEILQMIAEELPMESSVLLSLTSKTLHTILPQGEYQLSRDKAATYRFLQLLIRDIGPLLLLCGSCNKAYQRKREGGGYAVRCPHFEYTFSMPYSRWHSSEFIGSIVCNPTCWLVLFKDSKRVTVYLGVPPKNSEGFDRRR